MLSSFRSTKFLWLAALGAIVCARTQTALADCAPSGPSASCVCQSQYPAGWEFNAPTGVLVRIRATAVADGFLQAELLEVVQANHTYPLEPGAMLGRIGDTSSGAGSLLTGAPCSNDRSEIVVGAELLAYYHPGDELSCEQFRSCAIERCDRLEDRTSCRLECNAETEAICNDEALLNGYFSWAVPWRSELDFGAGRRLASSNIDVLFDAESCRATFPGPPAQPCHDTSIGCALASGERSSRGAIAGLSLVALCACFWRFRRSRRG